MGDLIARSIANLPQRTAARGIQRACYRMVLSPEDARGLDLRAVTRATLTQLEVDCGGELPGWIAAEHRNTAHPHTHVVLAARVELAPGQYRPIVITRRRLARMKVAMLGEISRQRGERTLDLESKLQLLDRERLRAERGREGHLRARRLRWRGGDVARPIGRFAGRVARRYLREAELVRRERDLFIARQAER